MKNASEVFIAVCMASVIISLFSTPAANYSNRTILRIRTNWLERLQITGGSYIRIMPLMPRLHSLMKLVRRALDERLSAINKL